MARVFISYSHDSDDHRQAVRELADWLRTQGHESRLDQYVPDPDEGWPRWMKRELAASDFVLMVPTATYRRRWDGLEEPGKGLGVTWEGLVLTNRLYEAGGVAKGMRCVLVGSAAREHVPDELKGHTSFAMYDDGDRLLSYLGGRAPAVPTAAAVWTRPRAEAWDRYRLLERFLVDAFPVWELEQIASWLPDKGLRHALPGGSVPPAHFAHEYVCRLDERGLLAGPELWELLREKRDRRVDEIEALELAWR
ncbi:toll/interleukin-1 receptor domain-containing protein [Myxococcota bacterium]|nr:toll/interleukin-1 receptor domain-containing protein [Myxococcota bacterium]